MKKLTKIDDVIAEGVWHCFTHDGKERATKITIGRPTQDRDDPNKDWYCPIQIEKFTEGIITPMGVGSPRCNDKCNEFSESIFLYYRRCSRFRRSKKETAAKNKKREVKAKNN
jgi:hypothetical protein